MPSLQELNQFLKPNQISTSSEDKIEFGKDWTRYYQPNPQAILFPKTTEEVQKIVLWARKNKISLVPSGGRTGLSGAAVAKNGEVVVSMKLMDKIYDLNSLNMTIHCQAGVITETLQEYAVKNGYYFPVDFASRGSSHIGGNIATNAGGIKVLRYGLMRNWVASLTVVTGAGEILHLNNSLIKNATGYDLRQLFIGSEGTLGFITEVHLHVTHPPKPLHVFLLSVPNLESVMKVFEEFKKNTSLMAFEMFTDVALKLVMQSTGLPNPINTEAPIYLLVEFEEVVAGAQDQALTVFESCIEKGWVLDGVISQNEAQLKQFWRYREDISEACSSFTPYKNDISVSISKVPEFMLKMNEIYKKEYPEFEVVWFGHIGDGNLHINILKPTSLTMDEFVKKGQASDLKLFSMIQSLQGSISAEHGVGLSKKPFLNFTRSKEEIQIMKQIKFIFDPDWIINPNKIFDR